jgi:hypothetical protein
MNWKRTWLMHVVCKKEAFPLVKDERVENKLSISIESSKYWFTFEPSNSSHEITGRKRQVYTGLGHPWVELGDQPYDGTGTCC